MSRQITPVRTIPTTSTAPASTKRRGANVVERVQAGAAASAGASTRAPAPPPEPNFTAGWVAVGVKTDPVYDPFAAGVGYVQGSDADPTPRIQTGMYDPITGTYIDRPHLQEKFEDSVERQVDRQLAELEEKGIDSEAARELRRQAEAHQAELEAQRENERKAAEQDAYCKQFVTDTLKQVNKALADEAAEAAVLNDLTYARYPDLWYDLKGVPTESKVRKIIDDTIALRGREAVRYRDSDLLAIYASAARFEIVTARAEIVRQAVQMLEQGKHPGTNGENQCWAKYKEALANQPPPKKGSGKVLAFAALGLLLGVM